MSITFEKGDEAGDKKKQDTVDTIKGIF